VDAFNRKKYSVTEKNMFQTETFGLESHFKLINLSLQPKFSIVDIS